MAQSQRPYGTPPHRRTDAPGASPVELRRACVPTRPARSRAPAGTTGPRLGGRSRRALVAVPVSPTDPPAPDLHHAHDVMRGFPPRARATAAPRSPTPTAEGSTPSEPAPPRPHRRGTCSLTTADASSPGPRHGSRHTTPMRASPSTGTTRIHAVVAQPGQSTRLSSGESRVRISSSAPPRTPWVRDLSTWPNWRRHRATNPAVAGSSPAVDPTARARAVRATDDPMRWDGDPSTKQDPTGMEVRFEAGWVKRRRSTAPRPARFPDHRPRGRRPTARTSARHADDAGSTPADHTTPCPKRRARDPSPETRVTPWVATPSLAWSSGRDTVLKL